MCCAGQLLHSFQQKTYSGWWPAGGETTTFMTDQKGRNLAALYTAAKKNLLCPQMLPPSMGYSLVQTQTPLTRSHCELVTTMQSSCLEQGSPSRSADGPNTHKRGRTSVVIRVTCMKQRKEERCDYGKDVRLHNNSKYITYYAAHKPDYLLE